MSRARADDTALIIGRLFRDGIEDVHEAIRRAALDPVLASADDVVREVREGRRPAAVVLDESRESELALAELRGTVSHQSVPVIRLVKHATTASYVAAHDAGADGVVSLSDLGALTRQVISLARVRGDGRQDTRHEALIFGSDAHARTGVGRLLAHAGYDLAFARELDEASEALASPGLRVVVLVHDAALDTRAIAARAHAVGRSDLSFVICARPDEARALVDVVSSMPLGVVLACRRVDASLLFALNELMRPSGRENRASARLLHGTLTSFRKEGELLPSFGLSSNLSAEGFYVRTLDPPEPGTPMWLELRPVGARDAVHLRAVSVWRQLYSRSGVALSAPGFGARIERERCAEADVVAYAKGYAALRAQAASWPDGVIHVGSDEEVV